MNKAKSLYQTITGVSSNNSLCPDLDLKTRIIGFIITFIVGIFMMISSISQLFTLALGGQRWFAVWYVWVQKQCDNMMKPERKLTSNVLFLSMILSLILAFTGISKLIIMITVIIQFLALIWYVLSYIPGAQKLCSACIKKQISRKEDNNNYTEMTE